jgi:ubiquitin-protein ligase E3 C
MADVQAMVGGGGGGGSEDGDGSGGSEGEDGGGGGGGGAGLASLAARRLRVRGFDHVARFEFLGQLLGKALFEGILVEPRFAPFVLLRMLGRAPGVEDLPSLDRRVASSLASLLSAARRVRAARAADPAAADEVDAMGLTMAVGDAELVPGGREVAVTAANAERYAALFAHHHLSARIAVQVRAFLRGFRELVPLSWLHMFAPHELQLLLSGEEVLDAEAVISDLRAHTVLAGGFDVGDPYMDAFWGVLASFSPAELRKFLAFVTSVPRPPLLGFATLSPKFGIKPLTSDSHALPCAGTCYNMLYLPRYSSTSELREKLLLAISETEGFGRT